MSDRVTLDVGGTRFATSWTTLRACGYFEALEERWRAADTEAASSRDALWLDRDPELFAALLFYLRTHVISLPTPASAEMCDAHEAEAAFYACESYAHALAMRRMAGRAAFDLGRIAPRVGARVTALAVDAAGTSVCAGFADGSVWVCGCDAAALHEPRLVECASVESGHAVVIATSGNMLAVFYANGNVAVYDCPAAPQPAQCVFSLARRPLCAHLLVPEQAAQRQRVALFGVPGAPRPPRAAAPSTLPSVELGGVCVSRGGSTSVLARASPQEPELLSCTALTKRESSESVDCTHVAWLSDTALIAITDDGSVAWARPRHDGGGGDTGWALDVVHPAHVAPAVSLSTPTMHHVAATGHADGRVLVWGAMQSARNGNGGIGVVHMLCVAARISAGVPLPAYVAFLHSADRANVPRARSFVVRAGDVLSTYTYETRGDGRAPVASEIELRLARSTRVAVRPGEHFSPAGALVTLGTQHAALDSVVTAWGYDVSTRAGDVLSAIDAADVRLAPFTPAHARLDAPGAVPPAASAHASVVALACADGSVGVWTCR